MEIKIRQPAVAGAFYPADSRELKETLDIFFKNVSPVSEKREPRAIIVPHAGYVYSGQVAAHAFARINSYKKIILLGPSHHVYLNDIAGDTHTFWETPLGKVRIIESNFLKREDAHSEEHCLEVQIPFLQYILPQFDILPLVVGEADSKYVSEQVQSELDKHTLLVISSDLSHYHDYQTATELDKNTVEAIERLRPNYINEACGKVPILAVLNIAQTLKWEPKILCYKNSGDVSGDKSRVVGYVSVAFYD